MGDRDGHQLLQEIGWVNAQEVAVGSGEQGGDDQVLFLSSIFAFNNKDLNIWMFLIKCTEKQRFQFQTLIAKKLPYNPPSTLLC